jgi:hypothetical protein
VCCSLVRHTLLVHSTTSSPRSVGELWHPLIDHCGHVPVAQVKNAVEDVVDAKRLLREIKILKHFIGTHCTALHCTALHCTALHCTALHCTEHGTALHCTALHYTAGTARILITECAVEY